MLRWAFAVLLVASSFGATAARACLGFMPVIGDEVLRADVVFVGKLIGYERVEQFDPQFGPQGKRTYGLMTFRVETTWKGAAESEVVVATAPLTDDTRKEWMDEPGLIVAALRFPNFKMTNVYVWSTASKNNPKRLYVYHSPCGPMFVVPANPENINSIRQFLY